MKHAVKYPIVTVILVYWMFYSFAVVTQSMCCLPYICMYVKPERWSNFSSWDVNAIIYTSYYKRDISIKAQQNKIIGDLSIDEKIHIIQKLLKHQVEKVGRKTTKIKSRGCSCCYRMTQWWPRTTGERALHQTQVYRCTGVPIQMWWPHPIAYCSPADKDKQGTLLSPTNLASG